MATRGIPGNGGGSSQPSLENLLMNRWGLKYMEARRLVAAARADLGMSKTEPWNEALEAKCAEMRGRDTPLPSSGDSVVTTSTSASTATTLVPPKLVLTLPSRTIRTVVAAASAKAIDGDAASVSSVATEPIKLRLMRKVGTVLPADDASVTSAASVPWAMKLRKTNVEKRSTFAVSPTPSHLSPAKLKSSWPPVVTGSQKEHETRNAITEAERSPVRDKTPALEVSKAARTTPGCAAAPIINAFPEAAKEDKEEVKVAVKAAPARENRNEDAVWSLSSAILAEIRLLASNEHDTTWAKEAAEMVITAATVEEPSVAPSARVSSCIAEDKALAEQMRSAPSTDNDEHGHSSVKSSKTDASPTRSVVQIMASDGVHETVEELTQGSSCSSSDDVDVSETPLADDVASFVTDPGPYEEESFSSDYTTDTDEEHGLEEAPSDEDVDASSNDDSCSSSKSSYEEVLVDDDGESFEDARQHDTDALRESTSPSRVYEDDDAVEIILAATSSALRGEVSYVSPVNDSASPKNTPDDKQNDQASMLQVSKSASNDDVEQRRSMGSSHDNETPSATPVMTRHSFGRGIGSKSRSMDNDMGLETTESEDTAVIDNCRSQRLSVLSDEFTSLMVPSITEESMPVDEAASQGNSSPKASRIVVPSQYNKPQLKLVTDPTHAAMAAAPATMVPIVSSYDSRQDTAPPPVPICEDDSRQDAVAQAVPTSADDSLACDEDALQDRNVQSITSPTVSFSEEVIVHIPVWNNDDLDDSPTVQERIDKVMEATDEDESSQSTEPDDALESNPTSESDHGLVATNLWAVLESGDAEKAFPESSDAVLDATLMDIASSDGHFPVPAIDFTRSTDPEGDKASDSSSHNEPCPIQGNDDDDDDDDVYDGENNSLENAEADYDLTEEDEIALPTEDAIDDQEEAGLEQESEILASFSTESAKSMVEEVAKQTGAFLDKIIDSFGSDLEDGPEEPGKAEDEQAQSKMSPKMSPSRFDDLMIGLKTSMIDQIEDESQLNSLEDTEGTEEETLETNSTAGSVQSMTVAEKVAEAEYQLALTVRERVHAMKLNSVRSLVQTFEVEDEPRSPRSPRSPSHSPRSSHSTVVSCLVPSFDSPASAGVGRRQIVMTIGDMEARCCINFGETEESDVEPESVLRHTMSSKSEAAGHKSADMYESAATSLYSEAVTSVQSAEIVRLPSAPTKHSFWEETKIEYADLFSGCLGAKSIDDVRSEESSFRRLMMDPPGVESALSEETREAEPQEPPAALPMTNLYSPRILHQEEADAVAALNPASNPSATNGYPRSIWESEPDLLSEEERSACEVATDDDSTSQRGDSTSGVSYDSFEEAERVRAANQTP